MNRRTKNVTATVHVSFCSLLVSSFFLFNVYRIIEYVYLRLMLSVMDQSTETNQTRRRAGRVCMCVLSYVCNGDTVFNCVTGTQYEFRVFPFTSLGKLTCSLVFFLPSALIRTF